MGEGRGGETWRQAVLRALNAPLTLWLLSAIGIGIFSSAYSSRNQCLADARRVMDDYDAAGLEWEVRVQALVPIMAADTPASANAIIAKARNVSATRQFKDASAYDVVMTLDRARHQIAFPESDARLVGAIDVTAVPFLKSVLLKSGVDLLKYDDSISPDEALGMSAGIASSSLPDDADFLATIKAALRNTVIVSTNMMLRDRKYDIRPNCSYATVLRQLFTGEQQPVLKAVAEP
jgi:hypothetical protein